MSSIEITPELMAGFMDEAPEYLEMLDAGLMEFESKAGSGVLALETDEDRERMTVMFRAAHSLKGLAAAFGFEKIKDLTHLMETLFDQVRMRKRDLSSESFEVLFNVFDRLKALVSELSEETDPPVVIDDVIEHLNQILDDTSTASSSDQAASAPELELPEQPNCATEGSVAANEEAVQAESSDNNTASANISNDSVEEAVGEKAETAAESESEDEPAPNHEMFNDPELTALFVETTAEALDEINQGLLKLEEMPDDFELLNRIFRAAHNVKGSSAAVGLMGMNRLTHGMETILDLLRNAKLTLDEELMNALFAATDKLRVVVDTIREGRIEDLPPGERDFPVEQWENAANTASSDSATPATDGQTPKAVDAKQETEATNQIEAPKASTPVDTEATDADTPPKPLESDGDLEDGQIRIHVSFAPEADDASINAYLIYNKLNDMGTVASSDPDIDSLTGDTVITTISYLVNEVDDKDAVKAAVELFPVASVTMDAFDADADLDIDAATNGDSPQIAGETATNTAPAVATATNTTASPDSMASIPDLVETPAKTPATPADSTASATKTKSANPAPAPAVAKPAAPAVNKAVPASVKKPGAKATTSKTAVKTGETLRVDQERLDELMNLGGELVINRARFAQIHDLFREVFDGKNLGYLVDDMADHLSQINGSVERLVEQGSGHGPATEMLSHLMHMRDSFDSVRSVVQRVYGMRSTMYDFGQALHTLGRVSDGIQKGIMSTRMVPVGPLFGRFKRVVRDICKSTGKQVDLVLVGEATELDKRMIDELGDPLTHMVRNSVDHGIESPEDRVKAGKPEKGTVTLEACHRGNSICIIVTDDGAGINIERVKAKIIERSLATEAQVEKMTDKEIALYVMQPGFSTAQQVSDLSGRGMGMDIVMAKIDKLSGVVDLDTTPGEGTKVTIKLPLTLAILTSMVSRVGDGVYAIPLEAVAEIITIRKSDIQQIQRRQVVRVRDRVVPVTTFEQIFETDEPELQTKTKANAELTLVIIGFEDQQVGLVVDELLGQEDIVIKSIAENYRNVKGFAGASIRGDGSVSLILDVVAVMDMASNVTTQTPALVTA